MRSLTHTLTNFLLYSEVIFPPLDKIDVNLYTIAPPLHRLVGSFLLILIINLIWMGTLYLTQYYQCLQEHPTEIRSILLFVTSTRIEFSPYRVTQQIFKFCLIFFCLGILLSICCVVILPTLFLPSISNKLMISINFDQHFPFFHPIILYCLLTYTMPLYCQQQHQLQLSWYH